MFGLANEKDVEALLQELNSKIDSIAVKQQEDINKISKSLLSIMNQPKEDNNQELLERIDNLEAVFETQRKAIIRVIDIVKSLTKDKPQVVEKPRTLADNVEDIKKELTDQNSQTYTHRCLTCRKECEMVDVKYAPLPSGIPAIEGACKECGGIMIKPGVILR